MALGIMITSTGEYLQLFPGTELELEDYNPFLQFTEEGVKGGFSFPFDVKNSARNLRLLNYAGIHQKRVDITGIDALLFDNGLEHGIGKLKVEKPSPDLNNAADGKVSCYFLSGASSFFQDIKDKRLRDIDMGGVRSFIWDGFDPVVGAGFWQHIHAVLDAPTNGYDYAFYPVLNNGWPQHGQTPKLMNEVDFVGGRIVFNGNYVGLDQHWKNRIVPFPYLHNVVKQAFAYVGWKVRGDILEDETFKKITMINFRAIDWCNQGGADYTMKDPVTFDLADNLPNKTIAHFLIQLQNRLGWEFKFERASKTCTIRLVKDAASGTLKDYTSYADPVINKTVLQQRIIHSLITNDGFSGGKLDLSLVIDQGRLDYYADLPAAAEALAGHLYLIVSENNYYICETDGATWSWNLYNSNLFDYIPDGATEEIITEAGTVSMERFFNTGYGDYIFQAPRVDNYGEWPGFDTEPQDWGIHLAFYHGQKNPAGADVYPYASNGIYDLQLNKICDWGLTYTCYETDGTDVGVYATFWRDILTLLQSQEEIEVLLNLPRHLYMQLDYTDQLLIGHVRMFVKTKNLTVPYKNKIKLTCLRI